MFLSMPTVMVMCNWYVKKISDYKRDLRERGTGLGLVHIIIMKNCELELSIAARLWATL